MAKKNTSPQETVSAEETQPKTTEVSAEEQQAAERQQELSEKQTKASVRYAKAQQAEKQAREGKHANLKKVNEAKEEQAAALAELDEAAGEEGEGTVTLVGPNDEANLTDALGIEWREGKAEVPRSLAERYVADFSGYAIQ